MILRLPKPSPSSDTYRPNPRRDNQFGRASSGKATARSNTRGPWLGRCNPGDHAAATQTAQAAVRFAQGLPLDLLVGNTFIGLRPGTATITARDLISGKVDTATLTVSPLPPPPLPEIRHIVSIDVTPDSATIVQGEAQLFMAHATFSDGSTQEFGISDGSFSGRVVGETFGRGELIWTSSNPTAAVANQFTMYRFVTGFADTFLPEPFPNKFVGLRPDTVTITAKDPFSPVKGTAKLTVQPINITITPISTSVVQGHVVRFSATVNSSHAPSTPAAASCGPRPTQRYARRRRGVSFTGRRHGTVTITGTDIFTASVPRRR